MVLDERSYSPQRRDAAAGGLRGALVAAPGLPAQALALVTLLYLAATDGGYYAIDWYPAGLVVLALVGLWAVAVPPQFGAGRVALAALVLLSAFAAWALVSISWAGEPGTAWDGGNRALLYAALFALFALWPVPPRQAGWLIALVGFGIALIGLVELLRWQGAEDPSDFMLAGRLSEPVGYQNGDVALWLTGALACTWLAAKRDVPALARGLALGAVPLLASLAWLGQSRGSLFALPLALLVFLALTPGRLRLLAVLVPSALAVAVAAGPGLDVIDAPSMSALPPLVDDAARAILFPSAALVVLGTLVALADHRWTPSPAVGSRIVTAASAVVVLIVLGAAAVAVTQAGEIRSELSERWDEFKSNEGYIAGSARLSSGGTNRYDFWTVAWDSFEREPLRGVGMDNFQQDYVLRGDSREKPRFPHSFELSVLSQTGLVGALLLLGGVVAALVAALGARRRLARVTAAGPAMVALSLFAYWLLHASVDWLYELPALGGLAFAMLGLAAGATGDVADAGAARRPGAWHRLVRIGVPLLAAAAAVSFALPWLAERDIARAVEIWRSDPDDAYSRLDRAAALNPLSVKHLLFEGAIANERRERGRARQAYLELVEREPRNAFGWLQLAALASARQDRGLARRYIMRAAALAPRDQAIRVVRSRIAAGAKITPEQADRLVLKYSLDASE
jgi:hypothetical protein